VAAKRSGTAVVYLQRADHLVRAVVVGGAGAVSVGPESGGVNILAIDVFDYVDFASGVGWA
jgi:hypothetical protein